MSLISLDEVETMNDKEKIEKLIVDGEYLISRRVTADNPELTAWHTSVARLLTRRFGDNSIELNKLKQRYFAPRYHILGEEHDDAIECVRDLKATVLELREYLEEENNDKSESVDQKALSIPVIDKIFIVHGHDGEIKEAVARLLEKQGIIPIILNEQVNQGQTIIEKFEKYANVGAAIALFTNDDVGYAKNTNDRRPRARQNVVFEAGYFMGKFGRDRVILIAEKEIEIPSDLSGVVYTDRNNWQFDVCKELHAMGYSIDMNKLLG